MATPEEIEALVDAVAEFEPVRIDWLASHLGWTVARTEDVVAEGIEIGVLTEDTNTRGETVLWLG